jgi:CheY-like chemotaxis protein
MSERSSVVLVTSAPDSWSKLINRLSGEGFAFEVVPPPAGPGTVPAGAQRGDRVMVVDLVPNPGRGMDVVTACRRTAPATPVVAVAENLSVEMARNVRAAGVFYLALHPVTTDEMRTVLEDARRSIGRKKPAASTCRTKKRVLIVDDDADYRASMVALLEGEGYAVDCAASAREGLDRLGESHPDLIVLDIMMEDALAGYGVNQAVKFGDKQAVAGHVPILMVSSIEQPPQELYGRAGEAAMITPDDYLTKPLDIPVFLEHVRRLLAPAGRPE